MSAALDTRADAARDILREFWRLGVKVELAGDRFRLTPAGVAPEHLRAVLREYRADVEALLSDLPAGGRCVLCGDPTGWPERSGLHCGACCDIALDRVLAELRAKKGLGNAD